MNMTQLNWPEVKEVGVNINFFQMSKIQLSCHLLNYFEEFSDLNKDFHSTCGTERIIGLWSILKNLFERPENIEVSLKCKNLLCEKMFHIYFSHEELKKLSHFSEDHKKNLLTSDEVMQMSVQHFIPFLQNKFPGKNINEIDEMLNEWDPLVGLVTQCECPECHHPEEYEIDLEGLALCEFWMEQKKVLHEILLISRRLGWNEDEILKLPRWRRKFYLNQLDEEEKS